MADVVRDRLNDLNAQLEQATTRQERSRCNKHIRELRYVLRFCETRAAYVPE